jgi:DNA recombination protein RmuC
MTLLWIAAGSVAFFGLGLLVGVWIERRGRAAPGEERLLGTFKAAAADALRSNNEAFLQTARAVLDGSQERAAEAYRIRQEAIAGMVQPVVETMARVDARIQEVERVRQEHHGQLSEQIRSLVSAEADLRKETETLSRALRAPGVRGRWGELQLRRVVELAGMMEHCDFSTQLTLAGEDRLRPDLVVHLPNGRSIVVDAKVPLQHYLDALEASGEDERKARLAGHARQLRRHVDELASREYWSRLDSPDFVVLFLPGEVYLSAAFELEPGIIEHAVTRKVLIATPLTLVALLKAVAYGWREERVAENARAIAALGRELHDRLGTLVGHVVDLRKGLERSVRNFNSLVGALESRVLVTARRFRDLGAAGGELADPGSVDARTRVPVAAEPIVGPGVAAPAALPGVAPIGDDRSQQLIEMRPES